MSHIVQIKTRVRDVAAVRTACQRLGLPEPVHETVRLFSRQATGLAVRLADPAVFDLAAGSAPVRQLRRPVAGAVCPAERGTGGGANVVGRLPAIRAVSRQSAGYSMVFGTTYENKIHAAELDTAEGRAIKMAEQSEAGSVSGSTEKSGFTSARKSYPTKP